MTHLADKAGFDGSSSTLVCAYADDGVMVKHLGDSRAYLFRDNWHCLTQDHSFINELKAQDLEMIAIMPAVMEH